MTREAVYGWLATQRPAMEEFLQRLVDIDSNSYDKAGTDAVADAIAELLAEDGVAVDRHPVAAFGDVLAAQVPGRDVGAHVLLMGHRDTVFPKGTVATRGYTRDGDLAFGPGVADMKSGLVLNCFVLRAFARAGGAPFPLRALFTSDEEIGSAAGRPFIEAAARNARAVLNAEPGRITGNVVTSRKGGATLILEVAGRAAHSGMAHADGISAIEVLAAKIRKLHALTDYATGLTINVGKIAGGVSVNTVAPAARAEIDVRVLSLAQLDDVMARIEAIVAAEELPGATATLTRGHVMLPLEERHAAELMARYRRVAAEIGFEVEGEFTGGCADSGFTASLGVPTLCGLGPVGGKPHTDREFCRLETLVPRAQAVAGTILSLA
ncbi:MAG: M20 family metallopeptidase [Ferrovibrionaceae bacterium]